MTYGPTTTPTPSPIAFDGAGRPRLWWDCGLPKDPTKIPKIPKLLVDLETPEGESASAFFPSGVLRRLVVDEGRELVAEHFAVLRGELLGPTLGVHLFTEQRSDGLVACELVGNNGTCNPQIRNSWPGCVRFRKIRARILSPGWAAVGLDLGAVGDFYFGIATAFSRRFVLYQTADVGARARAERLLAHADLELPNPFPGLGPGEHVLPRCLEHRWDHLYDDPVRNGPQHPDTTTKNGYAQAGDRIWPVGGIEGSEAAARQYALDVNRVLSRHGVARVHSKTGRTIKASDWPAHKLGGYVQFDNRWSVDDWNWPGMTGTVVGMFGWDRGPNPSSWKLPREVNPGPSASRQRVLEYEPHDRAHLVRVGAIAVPAWFQTRSFAARLLIEWTAHDTLTAWPIWDLIPQADAAEQNPGRGGEYARAIGWAYGSVANLLSITPPGPERSLLLAWRFHALRWQTASVLANGFPRNGLPPNSDNGEPWQQGLPVDCGACVWFQIALWAAGLFDLWTAGGGPIDGLDASRFEWILSEALLQGLDNPSMPLRDGSPPNYVGVTRAIGPGANPVDAEVPCIDRSTTGTFGTAGAGTGHAIHDWTHLALWKRCGVDPARGADHRAPDLATKVAGGAPSIEALKAAWRAKPDPWNAIAAAYL